MSDKTSNAYSDAVRLHNNGYATAAAVDMLTNACSSSGEGQATYVLQWAIEGDNLKTLRDKIKAAASE